MERRPKANKVRRFWVFDPERSEEQGENLKSERRFAAGQERSWGPSAAGGPGVARAVHQALSEVPLQPSTTNPAGLSGTPLNNGYRNMCTVRVVRDGRWTAELLVPVPTIQSLEQDIG